VTGGGLALGGRVGVGGAKSVSMGESGCSLEAEPVEFVSDGVRNKDLPGSEGSGLCDLDGSDIATSAMSWRNGFGLGWR